MKIVNRAEFLKLPENTLFSKYRVCCFGELEIKGKSYPNDFMSQEINSAIRCDNSDEFLRQLEQARAEGVSLSMDFDVEGRDGLFENDQLFAVWEDEDVEELIARLLKCLYRKEPNNGNECMQENK